MSSHMLACPDHYRAGIGASKPATQDLKRPSDAIVITVGASFDRRSVLVAIALSCFFTLELQAKSPWVASAPANTEWWQTAIAYCCASLMFAFFAWLASSSRKRRLRKATEAGRLVREHVEVLLIVTERCAEERATRVRDLCDQLGMDKYEAKRVIKELMRFGCAKNGQVGGYVPTDTGIEFLQSIELDEFTSSAAEVLDNEDRLKRIYVSCAAASSAMAGMGGGDGGAG